MLFTGVEITLINNPKNFKIYFTKRNPYDRAENQFQAAITVFDFKVVASSLAPWKRSLDFTWDHFLLHQEV